MNLIKILKKKKKTEEIKDKDKDKENEKEKEEDLIENKDSIREKKIKI